MIALRNIARVYKTVDPATQAVVDRIALEGWTTFNSNQLNAVNNFIIGLKATAIWAKARTIRLKRYNDITLENASRVNIKNPTSDVATFHGGFTYTVNGMKYNGIDSYTNEKINPVTAGLAINNFTFAHQFNDDFTVSGNALCGIAGTVPTRRIATFPKSGAGPGTVGSNVQSNDLTNSLVLGNQGIRLQSYGRNATKKTNQIGSVYEEFAVDALGTLLNYDYYTGALNDRNTAKFFCDGTDSFFYGGEWLSESEVNTLRNLLNIFYTSTGQTLIVS